MYDVIIIGGGVIGCATAYTLSKYKLKVAVLEKENDIADETTKANSGIVHAGFDCEENTLMAKLNVKGSKMIESISNRLDIDYVKCGSLVIAFNEQEQVEIKKLYQKGINNKVENLKILNKDEVLNLEPNLNKDVQLALYAPTAAVINPWELCIAMGDTAKLNSVDFFTDNCVESIELKEKKYYCIKTNQNIFNTKYIVNASGVNAEKIHSMIGGNSFKIIPNKGQYFMMDKEEGKLVKSVIFQSPNEFGKGVLVASTVHGNLIVGPNSENIEDGEDVSTTTESLEFVKQTALKSVPNIDFRNIIRTFAGVRARSDRGDFIIEQSETSKGFINLAGITSPGLSASPAIAEQCVKLLNKCGLKLEEKQNYIDERKIIKFRKLSEAEKIKAIKDNPLYGRIICRCETITEAEIIQALNSPIVPKTIDAIKKRCNTGMGRCQGGFCMPRVHEIISKQLKIPMEQVTLNKKGTYIITGNTKEGDL